MRTNKNELKYTHAQREFRKTQAMNRKYEAAERRREAERKREEAKAARIRKQLDRLEEQQRKLEERRARAYAREYARIVRENEKALKLQEKLNAQRQLEEDAKNIQQTNLQWTTLHHLNKAMTTLQEINIALHRCEYEQNHEDEDGTYKEPKPSIQLAEQQSEIEASQMYDVSSRERELSEAQIRLQDHKFEEIEPTIESVNEILMAEAKENIKCFLPWKRRRLRKEYIIANSPVRYQELQEAWQNKKKAYHEEVSMMLKIVNEKKLNYENCLKEKAAFITKRTQELFDLELNLWRSRRSDYYRTLHLKLQNSIDGDADYIISTITGIFPNKTIPCLYYVDAMYDEPNCKVYVDLDLPEIEDLPQQKVVISTSGKKSIRQKSQTDLRLDYAQCVVGLAMNVAYTIFNVSLKINEVEVAGYTQRRNEKSDDIEDQYVFAIDFDRKTFSKVYFRRFSAIQIIELFHRHINLSKTYLLKEIDINTATDKMQSSKVKNYDEFIKEHAR